MSDYKGGTIMYDAVEVIGKASVIQHGTLNNRVYLMKLDERDVDVVLDKLSALARDKKYAKLFCKVPKKLAPLFFADGYHLEAYIPQFYNTKEDVFFVSKFLDPDRLVNIEKEQLFTLSDQLVNKPVKKRIFKKNSSGYAIRKLNKLDVEQMADIYKKVFETYPFPIHDPKYILKTMNEDVQYFGAEKDGQLAALSSAEIDFSGGNAEMTDFATHFLHAGNNLSSILLAAMEEDMQKQGITVLYTIARLNSIPMNKTFLQNSYQYSGTLVKNTNISGKIESMNIYYKQM